MNIFLRLLFVLLLSGLIGLFVYEAYFGSSADGYLGIVIEACFFVPPLVLALALSFKLPTNVMPWWNLLFLCLFGYFQHAVHDNFAILLPFFVNVGLSYAIGVKCYRRFRESSSGSAGT
jgi:ABC-type dipeptide/oligopeptide/nickel transport system permease subunit